MQVETAAQLACPLCKRQFLGSSEHLLSTRLCAQCRMMVWTAFRGAHSVIAHSAAVVPDNSVPAPVESDAQTSAHGLVCEPASFELTPADAVVAEPQSEPATSFEAPDSVKFDFYQEEDPVYGADALPRNSTAFFDYIPSVQSTEVFDQHVHSIGSAEQEYSAERDYSEVDEPYRSGQTAGTESTLEFAFCGPVVVEDRSEVMMAHVEVAGTDDWQSPLANWNPDDDEWPILVAPTRQRSSGKLKFAVAAAVILASTIGLYSLIYSPEERANDAGSTASVVKPRSAAIGADTAALAQALQTQSDKVSAGTSQADETATRDGSTSENNAKDQFSLQAAAFPTQVLADDFAERLKKAGLPSYVVSADIARRGKWFRVRVGRFSSAENAQRFVGEAQQRARAAGLAVQLIVCQYGQP